MKIKAVRPRPRLLTVIAIAAVVACGVALIAAVWELDLSVYGAIVLGVILVVAVLDWWVARNPPAVSIVRLLPSSLPLGQWTSVTLRIRHELPAMASLELYDHYPSQCISDDLPIPVELRPGRISDVAYRLKPIQRGLAVFSMVEVRVASSLKLWDLQFAYPVVNDIRIYPNFSAVVGYSLLATDNHVSQLGIKRRPRRGEGTEFHQLREFREGDSIRQVDWKATSRRLQLVSREYQDERDQHVILMLDSGRRMRTQDAEFSHFDHALNASLMLAYVALRQGDSVGMMSFGHASRWVPAVKGASNIHHLLNGFYDLDAGPHASDYIKAGQDLLARQRKRSLVVVMTNVRDEDADDLLMGLKPLRRRHLVLVANLKEDALEDALREPVGEFEDALRYSATAHYLQLRAKMQERLQAEGVLVLDSSPQQLSVRIINRYLEIKRAGML